MRLLLSTLLLVGSPAFATDPAPEPLALEDVLGSIGSDRLFTDARVGVHVVDVRTGEAVWARDATVPLNPASTTKLLTAATALRTLGPAHTFTTTFLADDLPEPDGVLAGPLYVRGGGDPTLVVEKLWKMVRDLQLAGVKRIEGGIVLDESMFGPDHELPGWGKARDIERGPSYFPALSALSLNFNTVALAVRPGAAGKPAVVLPETDAGDYIEVVSTVKTGGAGSRRFIDIDRHVLADGRMRFEVSGQVPADDPMRRYYRSVDDPTRYTGAVVGRLLAQAGIEVVGETRLGEVPEEAEYLTDFRSAPLTSILMDMNKYSSNFMAETVLRAVGFETRGEGSTAAGLAAVQEYLRGLGLEEGYTLFNGSGLARDGAIAPEVLTAVLLDMARDPRVGAEFRSSLAIAGVDGTLRRRLRDAPNRLRGKTGTLDGVHGLAGYVEAQDGALYAFAFLANDFRGGSARVKRVHDEFAERMFDVSTDATADEAKE